MRLWSRWFETDVEFSDDTDAQAIRGDLYSVERLEQFALELADEHKPALVRVPGRSLLPRLEENGRRLLSAYRHMAALIRSERSVSPAAEWLVDNFHIVEEQLREVREDLPRGFYRELPKLNSGDFLGYPRIYAFAFAFVAHTDSFLDGSTLRAYTKSYQFRSILSIGELWAIPISLRLVLVENLSRLAGRILIANAKRERADALAEELKGLNTTGPADVRSVIASAFKRFTGPDPPFIVSLARRLREPDSALVPAINWIEAWLGEHGATLDQLVNIEHQRQAATQVTVANVIKSMRLLSTLDWREFFEEVSLVDGALARDPLAVYSRMDFPTRDIYRHVVERISKGTGAAEIEVAAKATELAERARDSGYHQQAESHVGYYLIDDGLKELEAAFRYTPSLAEQLRRIVTGHPAPIYLGGVLVLTTVFVGALFIYLSRFGQPAVTAVVLLLSVIPSSEIALSLINWLVTSTLKPRPLPKMETRSGAGATGRTMVVVPVILSDEDEVRELLEKIEVQYLANQDPNVFFALLSDFADAPREHMPNDDQLLEIAQDGMQRLNERYSSDARSPRFHLFHRRRIWNASEGMAIGWERKRGKLREFNRFLRGVSDTSFIVATADRRFLATIKYVITLDSDTELPRNTARRLIGVATHPLNKAIFDPEKGRVTRGYGILQPRVGVYLPGASRSFFSRIFSGNAGVDPYTTAVSDVYQDLFGEGSYAGKGLYDVDAFEAALAERVPQNTLLSHDLFEGLFARAALVTDIELLDAYPDRYDTYARRQHRWARGDWQVAPWLLPWVKDGRGQRIRNRIPLIGRWKILDNLRRSLVAPSALLLLITAWLIAPGPILVWTILSLLTFALPIYLHVTTTLLLRPPSAPWVSHLRSVWDDLITDTTQVALTIVLLLHQAYLMCDAVSRVIYRKLVSHRRLLEWKAASQDARARVANLALFIRFMWPPSFLAIVTAGLLLAVRPGVMPIAFLLLAVWFASPAIAEFASRPPSRQQSGLSADDIRMLRRLARLTWRFFENFVGEEDHWLPPDNYQQDPSPVVAHRTSPTNIGLLLLSTIAARDMGYIGALEMVERIELTFATTERLQKFRGHYFNWYDTHTLLPLEPRYVSTVDSGNLAGHLIALKQACIELQRTPLFDGRLLEGLKDTLEFIAVTSSRFGLAGEPSRKEAQSCTSFINSVSPVTLTDWSHFFDSLAERAASLVTAAEPALQGAKEAEAADFEFWVGAFKHQVDVFGRDLESLAPWADTSYQGPHQRDHRLSPELDRVPSPLDIADRASTGLSESPGDMVEAGADAARRLIARLDSIAALCDRLIDEMDFGFLFDQGRKVLTIGYNATEGIRDASFYDLFASEARLAGFVAIASGDIPQEHWFSLGRQLTSVHGNKRALISWTASMFEYLMPLLVMRSYSGTLLDETYHAVVLCQIEYGKQQGVPWGISESAYNARDVNLNYQYGPFGVPGLGLKRGLSDDLVIAPYATMLAALVKPSAAVINIKRLESEGILGRFGFYESVDFTADRLPRGTDRVVIESFMSHHQGMTMVALDNLLNDYAVQNRFHADPMVQATELLLQERIPRGVELTRPRAEEVRSSKAEQPLARQTGRHDNSADRPAPLAQVLSNGAYSLMITSAGSGYSRCDQLAVTRWREDTVRDNWGTFFYLRDVRSDAVWSAGYQPALRTPQSYEVNLAEDRVEIFRNDVGITTRTEIIVSPEDNAELRRITITNASSREREIDITSYSEIVLAPPDRDAAHTVFGNLFVETEFISDKRALLARRRPRLADEQPVWAVHTVVVEGQSVGEVEYETDRLQFIGRGGSLLAPAAIAGDTVLSGTVGAVLDPIFSLRRRVLLRPNETARVSFATAIARSREEALGLADKYHEYGYFARESRLAWIKAQVQLRHFNLDGQEAGLIQEMAGHLIYTDSAFRPGKDVLAANRSAQSALWGYGIGGDVPILLVRVASEDDLELVREVLGGHEYLRLKGVIFDLVVLNEYPLSYSLALQDQIRGLASKSGSAALLGKPGGVHLLRSDVMPEVDRTLLQTVARVCLTGARGSLEDQLRRREIPSGLPHQFVPKWPPHIYPAPDAAPGDLVFFNGRGGFTADGREYVMVLANGELPSVPWMNVIANAAGFGFQVSESGGGFTWSINSGENRLTPWSNDPVCDLPGEVIYIRDEESGAVWSPTPAPVRSKGSYVVRHGQGYTSFEHESQGIAHELVQFTPVDASVKINSLTLRSTSDSIRTISVTFYCEPVLGARRDKTAPFILTEIDISTGAVFARNSYNIEFGSRIMFAEISEPNVTVTCDRKEFLGRNGSVERPEALNRIGLSGTCGAGLDPCIAMQAILQISPGETRNIVILLGQAANEQEARGIISTYREPATVNLELRRAIGFWDGVLQTIQISTPDPALDLIINRWMLYQTLVCRIWARTGFYQPGGAYGFRDQLQDVMALVYSKPDIIRSHIRLAASRQFIEGDVQHWWHPPSGRGIRSRSSDDLLWLPYVTAFYVKITGDKRLLDEKVGFLEGPKLRPEQDESYFEPSVSRETGTIFEHCARAIDRSLAVGDHGLPLIGSGDWNDGMNRVGSEGKGESVWLGWFLYTVLDLFVPFCDAQGDTSRSTRYGSHMASLRAALEEHAWDGAWYRRAFFDDGTPLGSAENDECMIDSIAQSWSVISGAARPDRADQAMEALLGHLVQRDNSLVLLLTPPFDKSLPDPGYIKGYLPGVRENGAQYTHAGIWAMIACARLNRADVVGEFLSLLNPVNHSRTEAASKIYQVEPYVIAADVYASATHLGRGGWTWYTGSAGWFYRAVIESVLGFKLSGDSLEILPCIPAEWPGFEIRYMRGKTQYNIKVEKIAGAPSQVISVELDGEPQAKKRVILIDDGKEHSIKVIMGETLSAGFKETELTQEKVEL